ncbi:hypothetical protein P5704_027025 (plasmid) [Pseudomonas sp. FeN3W]|nr:hypothetical protein P5704_027025 [Pseudomonas sp. FeN3W]
MPLIRTPNTNIQEIYDRLGNASGLLDVFFCRVHLDGSPFMVGTDDSVPHVMHGCVSLGSDSFNSRSALNISISHLSDLAAIEGVFSDYLEYDKIVRDGFVPPEHFSTFCRTGENLSFRLIAQAPQVEGAPLKRCYPEETLVNSLDIGAMANDVFMPVVSMTLHKGRYTGICLAHDLALLKAISEGVSPTELDRQFKLNKKRLVKQDYDLVCKIENGITSFIRVPKSKAE